MSTITGGCMCGAVRYEIDAPPLGGGLCHCRDCQYRSGGGPATAIAFPRAAFRLTQGTLREYWTRSASGGQVGRTFCEVCGTGVSAANSQHPEMIPICAGSLDDPNLFRPQAHVWTGSAPAWHLFDADLPSFPASPG
ncbi:GFA family protein [Phenylobacterium sp.]|uniref:GFA family protein n=1 Tax=Phenylobacterium sp. TaxID=1871053 RepID=UPI0038F5D6AF